MNETKKSLICKFKDTNGKTRNVMIDSPIEPANSEAIIDFMETAIATDIFYLDSGDEAVKLADVVGAQISTTKVNQINL